MDMKSRLPECLRQAADAVSAYTQGKMEDAHKLSKFPKSECPDIWIRLPRHKWPKSWPRMEDPVVLLDRNLYGHPLAGLLWERQFGKVPLERGWEKVPIWECLFVNRARGLIRSVYVDDIKLAGKTENREPTQQKQKMSLQRLPDCDGQAAGAPSKNGGCSQIAQNSTVRMSRCVDTSST